MASSTEALVAVLILGFSLCSLNDIIVGTVRTGNEIQGMAEWKVTITNNCKCSQHDLKLTCKDFQSVETVDPSIFVQQGDDCLVIQGNTLNGFTSVSFLYAWDPPFFMFPSSSVVDDC
ncbi:uncharacterized protein LOC120207740 [Hibiscus syriacus]|uniref:uncharacterized protein LOC120207740 n=1 Tax=Hibiscus syriacus TaxID=106335 RepID=UPI001921D10E|nr:uncharacterized protein LOC120207740 [Hibiscus syriacus]